MHYLFYVGDGRKARSMRTKEVNLANFVEKFIRYATDTKRVLEQAAYVSIDICNEHYFVNRSEMINFAFEVIPIMKEVNPQLNITYEIKNIQDRNSRSKWLYFTLGSDKEKMKTYDANKDDYFEDYVTDTEMNAQNSQAFATALCNLQKKLAIISEKVALMY